jgi:hypothetical protein
MNKTLKDNLAYLDELKRSFGTDDAKLLRNLKIVSQSRFPEAESLISFHEILLYLRAYPTSSEIFKLVERILSSFQEKITGLHDREVELSALDDPEVSGIAGGSVTSNFSYAIVCWLAGKYPRQISIDWDWLEEEDRFGATIPRFLPLLDDEAMVEAHVPFRDWLDAARGRTNEVVWLIERFESLQISDKEKAELYDALKLHITWVYGFSSSRTGMRRPTPRPFIHDEPLIQRRDISLLKELSSRPIQTEKLSRPEGDRIIELARETSAVRYRELHGFTYGDARRVVRADLGRGTEVFVVGVSPEKRLPLRAYHAALIFKNGVPVAYFEGLSICERMESGFNLYYTFREGETAWLYARILRLMRQLLGVTVFSIDPYQVGHENEEGIESGAFWFYRKLGFRPVQPELMRLTEAEEKKMAEDQRYRTSAKKLRKLATGHMLFELPGHSAPGEWDKFKIRNIGLAVQRKMARDFGGDPDALRAHSIDVVRRILDLSSKLSVRQENVLKNLAPVLVMIPKIAQWTTADKSLAGDITTAKADGDEATYLKLVQKHLALRAALIELGSR